MTQKSVTIKTALDARQAAYFVQTAGKYEAEIQVSIEEKRINAKSIMGMMSLGLNAGESVVVEANGADEKEAVDDIEKYLTGKAAS